MGRFIVDQNPIVQTGRQLKIVKAAGLGGVKSQVRKLVSGDISPSDLMDPGKYISEDSRISTLLGTSSKRDKPKYYTPYGAAATDYLSLSIEEVGQFVDGVNVSGSDNTEGATTIKAVNNFVDLHALVSVQQKNNIVLTKVEGRDRSRKEFIAGGDYMIDIQGKVVSKLPEQYPEEEVAILIKMLNYQGVISVDNPQLNRFNINGIIILDWKMSQAMATHNSQSYQIKAVYEPPIEFIEAEAIDNSTKLQKTLKKINEWVALDTFSSQTATRI